MERIKGLAEIQISDKIQPESGNNAPSAVCGVLRIRSHILSAGGFFMIWEICML